MELNKIASGLLVFCAIVTSCSTHGWDREEHLDRNRNFKLSWNVTSTHAIFEMTVNTTGWIGVGISANGDMVNADIHVGWVKNGSVYLTDRHGVEHNGFPPLDKQQDLELIDGWECDGRTSITFKRQLAACGPNQDRPITRNTLKLIYAYNLVDPEGEDLQDEDIHLFRGTKAVLFFDKSKNEKPENISTHSFSVLNDGSPMSRATTYYHCRVVEIPTFQTKQHVIKIAPVIEERNIPYIHHMVLQACPANLQNPSDVGRGGDCYGGSIEDVRYCISVVAGWAVGGGAMVFPSDVGFPLGLPGQTKYLKLELHYTNPLNEEIFDHSGFRFTYTSQLRQHDANTMMVGHYLAGYNLVVPPNSDLFDIYGTCGAECLAGAMDKANISSINIISAFFHTHMIGKKVYLRHIRNGTEMQPVAGDDAYDFNFQETRSILPPRKVNRGDSLQTVCSYSNTQQNFMTEGGTATSEEMCATFVYVYPSIPLTICNSAPANGVSVVNKMLGVTSVRTVNESRVYFLNRFKNIMVTSPAHLANQTLDVLINNHPWTNEDRQQLSEGFRNAPLLQMCAGPQPNVPFQTVLPPYPKYQPYTDTRPTLLCTVDEEPQPPTTSRTTSACPASSE